MLSQSKESRSRAIAILVLLAVVALAYAPNLGRATIFRDDWYYAVDRLKGGPDVFHEMFRVDRPARAYVFEGYYRLFGIYPMPYHVSGLLWRMAGALGAYWLFRLIWPRWRRATLAMAILFALYPGYLKWMEGFENQPHVISLCLLAVSIALTVKAVAAAPGLTKIAFWTASALTGWGYLLLVDYAIGLEVFRFLCVLVVTRPPSGDRHWSAKRVLAAIRAWLPALAIPVGYLFWRLLIFQNARAETDVGRQFGVLLDSPLLVSLRWLVNLFRSSVSTGLLVWADPQFHDLFALRLREILIGLSIAVLAATLAGILWRLWGKAQTAANDHQPADDPVQLWCNEAIWIGVVGVVAGMLPIIMANRYYSYQAYSHYALPVSLPAATLVAGLLFSVSSHRLRQAAFFTIMVLALLTHFTFSMEVLKEERIIAQIWHQMAWRAPGLLPGTTLVAYYPSIEYGEDVDAVAGPANLIYFPEPTDRLPVEYQLSALPLEDATGKEILVGGERGSIYRTHVSQLNYDRLLVLTQTTPDSCVRLIDGRRPWYSPLDPDQVLLIGERSKIQNVVVDAVPPELDVSVFGPEPPHGWCYYFESAELALQQGDVRKAAELGETVEDLDLDPNDKVEWMPFLQAYAAIGDEKAFRRTTFRIATSAFNRLQACSTLLSMKEAGTEFTPTIDARIHEYLCADQP